VDVPLQGGRVDVPELTQVGELILCIEPAVSQAPAYQDPVLALHGAVVILVPGTGTGEADAVCIAGASQFVIDELAPAPECRTRTGNGR
jgi:hypothetical protein